MTPDAAPRTGDVVLRALDVARRGLRALGAGAPVAVATRVDGEPLGARLFVDAAESVGTLGDAALDRAARAAALEALGAARHEPETLRLRSTRADVRVLLEVLRPEPSLYVVGAGHIAVPLARIASIAGFRVTVLDDREEFADAARFPEAERVVRMRLDDPFADASPGPDAYVVLVTRAHRHDFDCLRRLLDRDSPVGYLGMIGSRRRVRAAFRALLEDGVPRERIARVRAPLGLNLGAETPEEIAVAVVAEMIAVRRGIAGSDAGAPLASLEDVVGRFFREAP